MLIGLAGSLLAFLTLPAVSPDSASALPGVDDLLKGGKDLLGGVVGGTVGGGLGGGLIKEVLKTLLGGLGQSISFEMIKWLVSIDLNIGPSLSKLGGPMVVIGGFFLVVGLITSVGDSYREVVAGTDTAARVIGQAIFRVIGLALLMGSWFWLVPLAVEVANGMSAYVLDEQATRTALSKSFSANAPLAGVNPLFALVVGLALVFSVLALVVMKFVIVITFAMLYLGGPVLIGFSALPRVGNAPLSMALRGTLTLMAIPLAWTVVFAAWAGVSAGVTEGVVKDAGDVVRVLTGPALFLAGMVVLFAFTKKLLSMASFGMPLSVPGARMLRMAATMAIARGAGAAIGGAGGAGKQAALAQRGQETANTPRPGGASTQVQQAGGGQGAGAQQPARRPLEATPEGLNRQRAEARATEEAVLSRKRQDENASPVELQDGDFAGRRRAKDADVEQMRGAVAEREATLGDVYTDADVARAAEPLGPKARGAFYGAKLAAERNHPGDPARQREAVKSAGLAEFAGNPNVTPEQRDAAITLFAQPPERFEQFKSDYERDRYRVPGQGVVPDAGAYGRVQEGFGFGDGQRHDTAINWPEASRGDRF